LAAKMATQQADEKVEKKVVVKVSERAVATEYW
jgi:hypothetical protein